MTEIPIRIVGYPPKPIFPDISIVSDLGDIVIVTAVPYKYKRTDNLSDDDIKGMIQSVLKINVDEWEVEADVTVRQYEYYGIIHLIKASEKVTVVNPIAEAIERG